MDFLSDKLVLFGNLEDFHFQLVTRGFERALASLHEWLVLQNLAAGSTYHASWLEAGITLVGEDLHTLALRALVSIEEASVTSIAEL